MSLTYAGWLPFYDMTVPGPQNYAAEGLWHHNTGKSEGAFRYVEEHLAGVACLPQLPGGHRMLMVAPTQGDAVQVLTGPAGLLNSGSHARLVGGHGGLAVRWPTGARMRVLGASSPEDEDRLRAGGNNCLVWMEELAAMRHLRAALDHTRFGLRIGPRPLYVGSTTPKARVEVRELVKDPGTIRTRGRTADATGLDPAVRDSYFARYSGTRLGRQELDAELLEDVEGALWAFTATDEKPGIEEDRLPAGSVVAPTYEGPLHYETAGGALVPIRKVQRCLVTVDPPGGTTEAGIMVGGTIGDHGYLLADLSGAVPPGVWARRAVDAYHDFGAQGIGVETAYGGDMVTNTIKTVDSSVPLFRVKTKVGKRLRAEPIVALAEQHRLHHVGAFPALEDQQTSWVPDESPDSPDRLDAYVHLFTYLLIKTSRASVARPGTSRRLPGR